MTFAAAKEYLAYFGGVSILAGMYFAGAKLGLTLAFLHASATPVWPPTGISIAALLLCGYRYWPAIFAGAFLANLTTEGTVFTSFGVALGNTLEACVAAYLVNRFANGIRAFETIEHTLVFISSAALISPVFSATIGIASLTLGGFIQNTPLTAVWFTWWLGDAVSALILVPFFLLWTSGYRSRWTWKQLLELGLFAVIFTISVAAIFFELSIGDRGHPIFIMPLFVWAALRFSPRETITAIIAVSASAVWATLSGLGPFSDRPSLNESLVLLQMFVIVIGATSLLLAINMQERKRAEHALHEAAQRKDDFLATLSHEIRNPLASLMSHVQLLQTDNKPLAEAQALHAMKLDLQHTTDLLEDLLDLSRVRRGRIILQREPVDIAALVRETVDTFTPVMKEHGHAVAVRCSEKPLWTAADRRRIKQMVTNLLSNATKFTDEGGAIFITCEKRDGRAIVTVKDSGAGIAPERLMRLFDADIPVTQSVRHSRGGLGIGLSLVKRLADLHEATLTAESAGEGRGSTFTLSFPLLPSDQIPKTAAKPVALLPAARTASPRTFTSILLVDDNEKAADTLALLLHRIGYKPHALYDGASALRYLSKYRADVVLLDIGLPDITGYDLAGQILSLHADKPPVLIALSGYGTEEDISRSREAGFVRHLVKPVGIEELTSVLKELA